ncbi:MAG: hypothetical protein H0X36_04590 [Sphingomonadaceae bacterium]|nr:hypothetical protein [Sphingomonadaceae bacterium]
MALDAPNWLRDAWWVAALSAELGAAPRRRWTFGQPVLLEGKAILEATEAMVRREVRGRDYIDISTACDHAGIEARRRVERLVKVKTDAA